MGGVLGLDYPGVEAVMRMKGVKNKGEMFEDLRVMEAAGLNLFNAK